MSMRGRNLRKSVYVLIVFSLAFISLEDIGARSQPSLKLTQAVQASQEEPVKKDSAENPPSGAQLYKRLCAACHGNDLKGNGPAPAPFKGVPPDLTTLAQRHGGKFPDEYFTSVLRNGIAIPDHGPPEMPSWGPDFRTGYGLNDAQVTLRITNLKDYIKSRQAK
jgi:mono/diheme cytochrome c family protein